jgi:uncharacterized protein YkwD
MMSNSYNPGDKVEVKVNGAWVEGTYRADYSQYSNMKATPHSVAYKLVAGSGTNNFAEAEVRPWTGMIQSPIAPRVEPSKVDLRTLEAAIIVEVNEMRANPAAYASKLAELKSRYKFVDGRSWYLNVPQEGGLYIGDSEAVRADHESWLDETIAALKKSPGLSQLKPNSALRQGADYFASDTGEVNGPNHIDSRGRGAQERAKLAGYMAGVNECIAGDQRTAFGTVAQLLIDWKIASRGHRENLMNKDTRQIGVACQYFPEKRVKGRDEQGEYEDVTSAFIRTVIQCGYGS